MFAGFLMFAGTELANAARTAAYVENFMPTFGLEECYDAENLRCVLGDEPYRSPALDEAPWYSPARPASAKFYGFYPLSVEGVEDSTLSSTVTELTSDGGVASRPRSSSKEIRVKGLLIGLDDEGVDAGMAWLKGALAGSTCASGNCSGDTLCQMAYLPECCDYSEFPESPVDDSSYVDTVGEWNPYRKGVITPSANGIVVDMPCGDDGAQFHLSPLIPGQAYRVEARITGIDVVSLEVVGNSPLASEWQLSQYAPPRTTWTLDFVAQGTSATLLLTNPGSECDNRTAFIRSLQVTRVPRQVTVFKPRFRPTDMLERANWTFSGTPGSVLTFSGLDPYGTGAEAIRFRYVNPTGGTIAIPSTAMIRRTFTGLTPGLNYTIVWNSSYSIPGPTPLITLSSASAIQTDLGGGWYSARFQATKTQETIRFSMVPSYPLPTGQQLAFTLNHLRVDLDLDSWVGGLPEPDLTAPATRTLYGVTLLGGPSVTERFSRRIQGSMVAVEFILNATHPHLYSEEIAVWPDPSFASYLVSNAACSNGFPVRTNYFTNPSFAVQAVGDTPSGGVGTYAALTFNGANVEVKVAAANAAMPTKNFSIKPLSATSANTFVSIPVSGVFEAGHIYTLSADVGILAPMGGGATSPSARSLVVTDGSITYRSSQLPNRAGRSRLSVTFVNSGTAPTLSIYNGDVSGGQLLYVSNIQLEESPEMTGFFSGASTDADWVGTANQSASVWTKSSALTIVDPDCEPVPLPPQPPSIELACPIDVDDWRRFAVPIPASLGGGWSYAAPMVTLTTESSEVRDVRVRFYANPFDRDLEELNPCDYCGEFFVSYIPPSTTMTIDAILREVVANVSGTGETQAMNLVSNIEGGPAEWPLLTCDIPYIMTVDVSPTIPNLTVQLAIARRE